MLLDSTFVRRLDRVSSAFTEAWLVGAEGRDGNPRQLAFLRVGAAVAPASVQAPELDFMNRVMRLDDPTDVPTIVEWYRRKGLWPWFEISPGDGSAEILAALAAEGAWPIGFTSVSVAPMDEVRAPMVFDVAVHAVDGATDLAEFSETLLRGHGVPEAELEFACGDLLWWPAVEGLHLALASIDGLAIGAAALYVADGLAYLANASVLMEHRGRGAHHALLAHRLHLAAGLGCSHVFGVTEQFGGASHRNLQGIGLQAGFTRVVLRLGG